MDPTLFASFRDANAAERAFNALLDLGVQPEDLSLLVNDYANGGPPAGPSVDEIDATNDLDGVYDPAIANGLSNFAVGEARREDEGSFRYESQVGGGISTSTRDDSADSIDQMDDSQTVAEDQLYPESGRSFSSQEGHDVVEAATSGAFNTTEPETDTIGSPLADPAPSIEVSSLRVNGLGKVLGDGILATLATGAAVATAGGGRPAAPVSDYLVDAGVPAEEVDEIYDPFRQGGAVLAATLRPGDAEGAVVEDTLDRFGAVAVRTYTDIPEPNG